MRGTLLLALTLTAYALAMTMGRGKFGLVNVSLLLAAALGAGLFVLAERRATSPLIRLTTLREPGLRASLAMTALVSAVVMATLAHRTVVGGLTGVMRPRFLGASAMGAVFAFAVGAAEVATARPEAVAFGMQVTFAVGAAVAGVALVSAVVAGPRSPRTS